MSVWLSVQEVTNLENIGERAVQRRIRDGKYTSVRQVESGRGGRGGKVWEIHISALPPESQAAYWREMSGGQRDPVDALQDWVKENRLRLTPGELADPGVQARLSVYRALHAVPKYSGRSKVAAEMAEQHGVSVPTVWRWLRDARKWRVEHRTPTVEVCGSPVALPRLNKFDEAAVRYGLSVYFSNRHAGKKAAYKALKQEADARGWKIGHYSNFTRLINRLPDQIECLATKGEVGFELEFAPKIRRDWLSIPPFSVLCGDQKVCDYLVFDPATGETYAMNYYLWIDCSTRYWAGLWPSFGPYNKYTVNMALREACRVAMPEEIYTDWGKPELSKYSRELEKKLGGCSVRLGDWGEFRNHYESLSRHQAQAGKPWHKPIENHMNMFERYLKDRFLEGYRHRAADAWVNKQQNMDLKRAREAGTLLSAQEYMEICLHVLKEHNGSRMNVQERDGGIIPAEALRLGLAEAGRVPYHEDTLDFLFLPSFQRKIRQSSVGVKVGENDRRYFYIPPEAESNVGAEPVQVLVDPFDPEREAIILTLAGEFVCHAERDQMVTPGDLPAVQERLKRQRHYMKFWKDAFREIVDSQVGRGVRKVSAIGPASRAAREAQKQERKAEVVELRGNKSKAEEFLDRYYDQNLVNE